MNRGLLAAATAWSLLMPALLGCQARRSGAPIHLDGGTLTADGGQLPADGGPRGDSADAGSRTTTPDAGSTSPTCTPGREDTLTACSDGCSNDGDAFIDCDDRDCCLVVSGCPASTYCGASHDAGTSSCLAGAESTPALCSDGCSNDGDAFIDCDDYDCCDLVACPPTSACGSRMPPRYVSRSATDCVGTGRVYYTFSPATYEMVTVAFSTSTGYQIFGYTRDAIASGPFPLAGTTGERQARVADLGSGLQMALASWGGSSWTSSEGGSATFSETSSVHLATDADALYSTYACIGYLEGSASAPILGGVDVMHFDFVAPILGLGFPGLR